MGAHLVLGNSKWKVGSSPLLSPYWFVAVLCKATAVLHSSIPFPNLECAHSFLCLFRRIWSVPALFGQAFLTLVWIFWLSKSHFLVDLPKLACRHFILMLKMTVIWLPFICSWETRWELWFEGLECLTTLHWC